MFFLLRFLGTLVFGVLLGINIFFTLLFVCLYFPYLFLIFLCLFGKRMGIGMGMGLWCVKGKRMRVLQMQGRFADVSFDGTGAQGS